LWGEGKSGGEALWLLLRESQSHEENPLPFSRKRIFFVGTGEARSASPYPLPVSSLKINHRVSGGLFPQSVFGCSIIKLSIEAVNLL